MCTASHSCESLESQTAGKLLGWVRDGMNGDKSDCRRRRRQGSCSGRGLILGPLSAVIGWGREGIGDKPLTLHLACASGIPKNRIHFYRRYPNHSECPSDSLNFECATRRIMSKEMESSGVPELVGFECGAVPRRHCAGSIVRRWLGIVDSTDSRRMAWVS